MHGADYYNNMSHFLQIHSTGNAHIFAVNKMAQTDLQNIATSIVNALCIYWPWKQWYMRTSYRTPEINLLNMKQ